VEKKNRRRATPNGVGKGEKDWTLSRVVAKGGGRRTKPVASLRREVESAASSTLREKKGNASACRGRRRRKRGFTYPVHTTRAEGEGKNPDQPMAASTIRRRKKKGGRKNAAFRRFPLVSLPPKTEEKKREGKVIVLLLLPRPEDRCPPYQQCRLPQKKGRGEKEK